MLKCSACQFKSSSNLHAPLCDTFNDLSERMEIFTFFSDCVLSIFSCASIPKRASNPASVCLILLSWDSVAAGFSSVSVPFLSSARQLNGRLRNLMALPCRFLRELCLLVLLQHLVVLAWGKFPPLLDMACLYTLVLGSVKVFIVSKDLIAPRFTNFGLNIPQDSHTAHPIWTSRVHVKTIKEMQSLLSLYNSRETGVLRRSLLSPGPSRRAPWQYVARRMVRSRDGILKEKWRVDWPLLTSLMDDQHLRNV